MHRKELTMTVAIYFYNNILGVTTLTVEQIKALEVEEGVTIKLVEQ